MLVPVKDHWIIHLIFKNVHHWHVHLKSKISNLEILSRLLLRIFLITASAQKDILKQLDIPGHES